MENEYGKTAAERSVTYLNGMKLDDDEVANIIKIRKKRRYPKQFRQKQLIMNVGKMEQVRNCSTPAQQSI